MDDDTPSLHVDIPGPHLEYCTDPHCSVNSGEQHVTHAAVLPAERENLPDIAGYLASASHPAWLRVHRRQK